MNTMIEQDILAALIQELQKTSPESLNDVPTHHAFLLETPLLSGALLKALVLAYVVLPESGKQEFLQGRYPDLMVFQDTGTSMKIEEAKKIIEFSTTGSHLMKVVIIEDMTRLTGEAANCLLKVIEEPHSKLLFIGTTGSSHHVLPTLTSRMLRVDAPNIPKESCEYAIKASFPNTPLDDISEVAGAHLGMLLAMADEWNKDESTISLEMVKNLRQAIPELVSTPSFTKRMQHLQFLWEEKGSFMGLTPISLYTLLMEERVRAHLNEPSTSEKAEKLRHIIESTYTLKADMNANSNKKLAASMYAMSF